jgi:hypothetical protein
VALLLALKVNAIVSSDVSVEIGWRAEATFASEPRPKEETLSRYGARLAGFHAARVIEFVKHVANRPPGMHLESQ